MLGPATSRGAILLTLVWLVQTCSAFVLPPHPSAHLSLYTRGKSSAHSRETQLRSSTASTSASVTGMRENDDGGVLEPPGEHYAWYSLMPLIEAGSWTATPGEYFEGLKEKNNGAAVYKAHPGIKCIAITDHASGKWFFNQPESVLDRQDGPYFGSLKCNEAYLGAALPALLANLEENHSGARDYTMGLLRDRLAVTQTALTHASDNFYKNLWENGLGDYPTVYETCMQHAHGFMLEWLFGMGEEGGQPLPPFKDFLNVNPSDLSVLLGLEVDTPVANIAGKILQAFTSGVTSEAKASVKVLTDSIRASKMWPSYSKILEESGVVMEDLENSLMFTAGFQASSALAKQMESCIGSLTANPDFLAELREELDGKELTMKSVVDPKAFPLLDSFHWEVLRLFAAPPFFFKSAKMDLVVPTSSGQKYQIRKGDMLNCHQPLVQIDEAVFGPDATEFKPKRFVGNPGLKDEVFAYAYANPSKVERVDGMPWGCAAHAVGVLEGILKVFYGRWVQEVEWEMESPPVIDHIEYLGVVGPSNMALSRVTPRKG